MKIAWLHSHFQNWMGGTKFVLEVVKRLQKRSQIEVFIQNGNPDVIRRFTASGIRVNNLNVPSTNSRIFWLGLPFFCRRDARTLQTLLDQGGFDVVISSMFPMNFLASMLRGKRMYQYCYEPFAFFWDREMIGSYSFLMKNTLRTLKKAYSEIDVESTRAAEKIFTLTPETEEAIRMVYGRPSVVTYLGVDTDFYRPRPNAAFEERYRNFTIALHNTDFTPPKRTGFLLEALPEIAKSIPDFKLLITCSIDDHDNIRRLKEKISARGMERHAEVLGFVDHDLLPDYYTLADIVVYPGTSQNGGTSAVSLFVLEAMSCGTPVLRSEDSKTEVLDGINGELFDPNDKGEFIQKLSALVRNREVLKTYAGKTRPYIIDKYSWDRVAEIIHTNVRPSV